MYIYMNRYRKQPSITASTLNLTIKEHARHVMLTNSAVYEISETLIVVTHTVINVKTSSHFNVTHIQILLFCKVHLKTYH